MKFIEHLRAHQFYRLICAEMGWKSELPAIRPRPKWFHLLKRKPDGNWSLSMILLDKWLVTPWEKLWFRFWDACVWVALKLGVL
jgi:hypothetical protein